MLNFLQQLPKEAYLLEPFFDSVFQKTSTKTMMPTNIMEKEDSYCLQACLPGYAKEEVHLTMEDGYLTIEAKKTEEKTEEKEAFLQKEIVYVDCSRDFYVGDVEEDSIRATFQNGILTVQIPKQQKEKVETKKQIAIE